MHKIIYFSSLCFLIRRQLTPPFIYRRKSDRSIKENKDFKSAYADGGGYHNAFGVVCFLAPVNLYDSGISGTSMFLAQITPEYLTLSVFLLLLNIPLFYTDLKNRRRFLPFMPFIRWRFIRWWRG